MEEEITFTKVLKARGYRVTTERLRVFSALSNNDSLSMSELVLLLSPALDRATVYRNIALFEKLGVVERINQGWKYRLELGELFRPHHHHIVCESCSKVVDIAWHKEIEESIQRSVKKAGFIAKSHKLEIIGICSSCLHKT